ncbi:MAG: hypothetical protein WAZ18_01515 [Alphaproteobacteria bacterium]
MMLTLANLLPSLAWTCLSASLLTLADILFRGWQLNPWPNGFGIIYIVYAIAIFFTMMSFFGENIAVATITLIIFNSVAYMLLAYGLYGDTLTPIQLTGISLGLAAIVVMKL